MLLESDSNGLLWNSDTDKQEIRFGCEAGRYCIYIDYIPVVSDDMDIMASLKIDGKTPAEEFRVIELPRCWVNETGNYFDENGDEYAGYLGQKETLMSEAVRDRTGLISEDLSVELDKGDHTFELEHLSGSMRIKNIRLSPVTNPCDYKEYSKRANYSKYQGNAITIEGEAVSGRSSREIPCYSHNDSRMSPSENGKSRINAFGGNYWYKANSSGTWEFEVPEDGLYKISMRLIQNNEGLISQRQILIDGEIPFAELESYSFDYNSNFRTEALGGKEPYLFCLSKGKHTITMKAVCPAYSRAVREFESIAEDISQSVTDIQMVTGTNPDPNFDYELDKKLPDVISNLRTVSERIEKTALMVDEICGDAPAMTSNIHADSRTMADVADKLRKIPGNLGTMTTIQGDMEDAAATLQAQPLGIDWISIQRPDEELYVPEVSKWGQFKYSFYAFLNSFRRTDKEKADEEKTINVWVARDREWGNVMQMMIHKDFEANYGIKVNLNILPSGNTTVVSGASPLLLSVVAGNTPDIALGCDSRTPVELAIRNELCDLNQFEDFDSVRSEFSDSAIRALSYEGKCYGLPETTNMHIMVYRTDVLEQNNIDVPETWEELMQVTLPRLSQIGANFYMGSSSPEMYATILYQMGGEIYNDNGDCMLNTPEAVAAFKQWTRCFVQYNVPQAANFYNEMRTGKLPIGICSLSEYMQLKSYATELTGKIRIAPVPGCSDGNAHVDHAASGSVSGAILFNKAQDKDACWNFLKWWMSEDVQIQFAREVEARVGATGRWMSGNNGAFLRLGWDRQEHDVLEAALPDYRTFYNVLGGYYSSRAISNAWTRTVFSGMDARDSIEQCYDEISMQIEKKRREYAD